MEKNIKVPVKNEDLTDLKIGDVITLTGNIITARDQAHKRILEQGAPLDIEGAAIFHAGPIISEDENGYQNTFVRLLLMMIFTRSKLLQLTGNLL